MEIDFTQAISNIMAQGPLVTFAIIALWYTRKDLAEAKADNKALMQQLVNLNASTTEVIRDNAKANTLLAERINDL